MTSPTFIIWIAAKPVVVFVCSTCGSEDIECTAWINMNTSEIIGSGNEGPSEKVWCPVCEDDDAVIGEVVRHV